jgi:peptidoglycan/xylan/chitin deacetylase (PgdA/CDA1 family)
MKEARGTGGAWRLPLFGFCTLVAPALISAASLSGTGSRTVTDIPGVMRHGPRHTREVALTFDACSPRGRGRIDTAVVSVLLQTRTPSTIFLGGKWARDVASYLRPLASDSLFEFGNHAYRHPHLVKLSDDSIRQELRKAQRAITRVIGRKPALFRAPYGEVDARVAAVAESLGLTVIQYDLPSGDPDSLISAGTIVRYVTSMARGGSIIVMHINTRGWHTAQALPEIIAGLRKKGYTFVTVSRLIAQDKLPKRAPPRRARRPVSILPFEPSPSRGTNGKGM